MARGGLVENDELALAGAYGERAGPGQSFDQIAVIACTVYDGVGADGGGAVGEVPDFAVTSGCCHRKLPPDHAAQGDPLQHIAKRRGPRVNDVFAGDMQRGNGGARQAGHFVIKRVKGQGGSVHHPVPVRLSQYRGQFGRFIRRPCHQHGVGFQKWQSETRPIRQIQPPSRLHQPVFQTVRRCVECRVQDCGIALARAVQNIGAAFQQNAADAVQRQFPEHRAANHTAADDRNVVDRVGHTAPVCKWICFQICTSSKMMNSRRKPHPCGPNGPNSA